MSSTPSNSRISNNFSANTGLGLNSKLTPSNSPYPRTPKLPFKSRGAYESGLSLKRVIGTTVSSPTAFDTLATTPIFAYTAGAATVVVNIDENSNTTQRFFRARPTAIPSNAFNNPTNGPSTPTNVANDGRNRAIPNYREAGIPYSPSTPHTNLDWDTPISKAGSGKGKIKAATSVSISRDGSLLAVGEAGVEPRILIFSLKSGSSDTPLAIMTGHEYGVNAIAFSPDQKYLASLGTPQDGFLHIWAINPRTGATKLHSSGKCTTNVKQMLWLGNSLVTVGTRHIKIWRIDEPRSASPQKRFALDGTPQQTPTQPIGMTKVLSGRNVVLGPLIEATFTTIATISSKKAIVCSEKGDVCMLDDSEGQKLMKVAATGFPITCMAVDTQERLIRIGGRDGRFKTLNLDQLLTPSTPPESPVSFDGEGVTNEDGHLLAMGYAARNLITINSKQMIEITNASSDLDDGLIQKRTPFPAHGDAVLGVKILSQPNHLAATFITWSADGGIVFWDLDGNCKATLETPLEKSIIGQEDLTNMCLVVRASKGVKFLTTGDTYGMLRIIDASSKVTTFEARVHSSDILDIALHENGDEVMLATCGRDMVVQLFRLVSHQWILVQTLTEHTASVSNVLFADNGEKLISCSANRDIQVRQIVRIPGDEQIGIAAIPFKIISTKSAPKSMILCSGDQASNIMVSMADRSVGTFEIATGRLVSSFRASDNDGIDTVALGALVMGEPSTIHSRPTILAGTCDFDKSVRVYNGNTGAFLDQEWGHTCGVKDVALLETSDSDQKTLVSTGIDGTIMIWDLSATKPVEPLESQDSPSTFGDLAQPKDVLAVRPPLRRVLSRAEIAEFQRASPSPANKSPPRTIRRKTSRYGLSTQSPTLAPPPPVSSAKHFASSSDDVAVRRNAGRNRSRSPPSPKVKDMRRPSLASLNDSRGRARATGNFSEYGSLNQATESACRTLRSYRKKLLSSEPVKDELMKELDQELRLTVMALGERSLKSKAISETVLTGLLDQYSERLVSMFDEKLKLTRVDSEEPQEPREELERPKTAGNLVVPSPI
ncbi:WD repeat protein-like protein [Amylocarpus encephaloides]|uniref:WD repeat protein-like protein n=1 Tax=Amylocarpus encephaloides TaxID=45428 RepID=A0A9P7YHS4_9HELO|nr:WD repeat protein-like protein [Amylocarpus encephaloides]